eukprot:5356841-Pyramimonas_sp.AAC.1
MRPHTEGGKGAEAGTDPSRGAGTHACHAVHIDSSGRVHHAKDPTTEKTTHAQATSLTFMTSRRQVLCRACPPTGG